MDVYDLKYIVLQKAAVNYCGQQKLLEKVYRFWKTEWESVFQSIDPGFHMTDEDFFGQDYFSFLMCKDQVIAFQSLNSYSLTDFFSDPYFKPCTVHFMQEMVKERINKFQALQFFIVGRNWSLRKTKINAAAILGGLNLHFQKFNNWDATMTLARKDNGAGSMASKFGMQELGGTIEMHNVPVGQYLTLSPGKYKKPSVDNAINYLWDNKELHLFTSNQRREDEQLREFI